MRLSDIPNMSVFQEKSVYPVKLNKTQIAIAKKAIDNMQKKYVIEKSNGGKLKHFDAITTKDFEKLMRKWDNNKIKASRIAILLSENFKESFLLITKIAGNVYKVLYRHASGYKIRHADQSEKRIKTEVISGEIKEDMMTFNLEGVIERIKYYMSPFG